MSGEALEASPFDGAIPEKLSIALGGELIPIVALHGGYFVGQRKGCLVGGFSMAIVWAYPLTSVASIDAIPHFFGVFIGDFSFMLYGEVG